MHLFLMTILSYILISIIISILQMELGVRQSKWPGQGHWSAGTNIEYRSSHSWSTGGVTSDNEHRFSHRMVGVWIPTGIGIGQFNLFDDGFPFEKNKAQCVPGGWKTQCWQQEATRLTKHPWEPLVTFPLDQLALTPHHWTQRIRIILI